MRISRASNSPPATPSGWRPSSESILDHVEALDQIDTAGVEPTVHAIPVATPLRDDVPEQPLDPDRALANAPERSGTAFVVPKVLDEDER